MKKKDPNGKVERWYANIDGYVILGPAESCVGAYRLAEAWGREYCNTTAALGAVCYRDAS